MKIKNNSKPGFENVLLVPLAIIQKLVAKRKLAWQREAIHNLSELLVYDPVIKVAEFNGIFALDASSDLFARIVIQNNYEPNIVRYCIEYMDVDKDVIDVGANIGFFTVMFAKKIKNGKVLAIEPTKTAIQRLRRNIELNDVSEKVEIFEGAALNKDGLVKIKTIIGKEEYSSLGAMKHPSISGMKYDIDEVIGRTIDDLVTKKSLDPGLIKVDVEGVENLVFEGAQRVLEKNRPIIISELSDFLLQENGSSSIEVLKLFKKFEYDVFDPLDPHAKLGTEKFGNIICLPKELKYRSTIGRDIQV